MGCKTAPRLKSRNALKYTSNYASSNWIEDFAELLTYYYLNKKYNAAYKIIVYRKKKPVFTYEPLKSEGVKKRFKIIEDILARDF
jgi:hypothetical protein